MKIKMIVFWVLRIIAAYILLQTLKFKFEGLPESIYIFTKIGLEPYGRIGSGIVELIASVLLLIPRTTAWGALLAIGTMSGAIFFHLTKLGIEVQGDHGQLFFMGIAVWISSAVLLFVYRNQLLKFLPGKLSKLVKH
jgi:uncharacterized membrane protein YphA (DoxX/SURF4 family)